MRNDEVGIIKLPDSLRFLADVLACIRREDTIFFFFFVLAADSCVQCEFDSGYSVFHVIVGIVGAPFVTICLLISKDEAKIDTIINAPKTKLLLPIFYLIRSSTANLTKLLDEPRVMALLPRTHAYTGASTHTPLTSSSVVKCDESGFMCVCANERVMLHNASVTIKTSVFENVAAKSLGAWQQRDGWNRVEIRDCRQT